MGKMEAWREKTAMGAGAPGGDGCTLCSVEGINGTLPLLGVAAGTHSFGRANPTLQHMQGSPARLGCAVLSRGSR